MIYSTNYFGSIPYFQSIAKCSEIVIDIHEHYKKQTWRNRTQILESNGPMYLSVPVMRPNGSKSKVGDIKISHDTNWRKDHWKALQSSYQHAPYFFYYGPQIKELIYQEEETLHLFNLKILKQLLDWLDLEIEISLSNEYSIPDGPEDSRIKLDKKQFSIPQHRYFQVFSDKYPFYPNLSIIDLIMNEGPIARNYILPKN
ncbi:WbqC family protein [Brumimicrobium mesophilum]|uniref:WbqC family protein n=1 Tax=Brumimicrobium mesophilum TaxID=392717 RepID=UPI000D142D8A|nr:WbqC family protein [Brumimicrobium mesophilum]